MKIITLLRKSLPGAWRYEAGAREWRRSEDGLRVFWVSVLAPQYDGDDDTFVSELWAYPTTGHPYQLLAGHGVQLTGAR